MYIKFKKDKQNQIIKIMEFIAYLSLPLSWFILAKNHSYIHYHLNTLLWYFGFVQFCIITIVEEFNRNKFNLRLK